VKGSCFCSMARAVDASCHSFVTVLGFSDPTRQGPYQLHVQTREWGRERLTQEPDAVEHCRGEEDGPNDTTDDLDSRAGSKDWCAGTVSTERDVVG
jgi:hypothetical protein